MGYLNVRKVLKYCFLLTSFICIVNLFRVRKCVSGNFTSDDILKVELGMSIDELYEILGNPYSVSIFSGYTHDSTCSNSGSGALIDEKVESSDEVKIVANKIFKRTVFCCEANYNRRFNKDIVFSYCKPVFFCSYYPELWVELDSMFNVSNVVSKRIQGNIRMEKDLIYSLSKNGKFIEEELFRECFD